MENKTKLTMLVILIIALALSSVWLFLSAFGKLDFLKHPCEKCYTARPEIKPCFFEKKSPYNIDISELENIKIEIEKNNKS